MVMFLTAVTAIKLLTVAKIALAVAPVCTAVHNYVSSKKDS